MTLPLFFTLWIAAGLIGAAYLVGYPAWREGVLCLADLGGAVILTAMGGLALLIAAITWFTSHEQDVLWQRKGTQPPPRDDAGEWPY